MIYVDILMVFLKDLFYLKLFKYSFMNFFEDLYK